MPALKDRNFLSGIIHSTPESSDHKRLHFYHNFLISRRAKKKQKSICERGREKEREERKKYNDNNKEIEQTRIA